MKRKQQSLLAAEFHSKNCYYTQGPTHGYLSQWVKNLRRNRICVVSKYLKISFNCGGKVVILHWRNGKNYCNQVIEGNTISVGHSDILNPWCFLRRTHHFCVATTWKHKTNPHWGICGKITDQYFSKVSEPWKTRKIEDLF